MVSMDYSRFYKGTESIPSYGNGSGSMTPKDTLVKYEFSTRDADGNVIMEKMSREETLKAMKEISAMYGDNVMVEFSGDGMAKLVEGKKLAGREMTEEEKEARAVRDKAFQAMLKPVERNLKILSSEELQGVDRFQNGENQTVYKYDLVLGVKAGDYRISRGSQMGYSLNDRAEDLTKAYADLFNEISKGYADGTRKAYAEDETSKGGVRLMTMEEEMAELDRAFREQAERIDQHVKDYKDVTRALKAYGEQLANAGRNKNADDVMAEYRRRLEEQALLPSDLADKMLEFTELFKAQYQKSEKDAFRMVPDYIAENYF